MALENEPNYVVGKSKWHNRLDEACEFLCLSISLDLLFHLNGLTTPNQVWTKLESLFGVPYESGVRQLDIALFSMSPSNFDYIEVFFTKLKSLVIMIKNCGIDKKYDQLILSILSKLGPEYSIFVSTFHATMLDVSNWQMSSLCTLFDSCTKDQ